jgi:hypothetical protein
MVVVCVEICFCCLDMEGGMDFFMFVLFLVRVVVFFCLVGCCLGFWFCLSWIRVNKILEETKNSSCLNA